MESYAMKDAIRVVLIDPIGDTRQTLSTMLGGLGSVAIGEVHDEYQGMARKVVQDAPDLVIVVVDGDPIQAVDLIQTLVQNCPNIAVLPASRLRDSSVILRVVRAGAREFLTLPTNPEELLETIQRLVRRDEGQGTAQRGPQVVTLTGAAGGVGCTTLTVNLATTLAKMSSQHEVILADFDLMFGSTDACLDIIPDRTLIEVVQNIDRLDATLLKRSLTRHASGLYVLPHPVAMEDSARVDPETLRRLLAMLKSSFPTVLIDTSKGLQSSDFVAFEMADVILMVVQLDLTCLRNTARLLQLFQQFDGLTERVKLIVNRAGSHDAEISLKKAEETLKKPISWQLGNATKIFHAARAKGVPVDAVAPGSKTHQTILEIARSLRPFPPQEEEKIKPRKGLFAAFF
jgi:pilus assembly protein CpaE